MLGEGEYFGIQGLKDWLKDKETRKIEHFRGGVRRGGQDGEDISFQRAMRTPFYLGVSDSANLPTRHSYAQGETHGKWKIVSQISR